MSRTIPQSLTQQMLRYLTSVNSVTTTDVMTMVL
jgi:hypothetical protein